VVNKEITNRHHLCKVCFSMWDCTVSKTYV
jgi:hypothetical protein